MPPLKENETMPVPAPTPPCATGPLVAPSSAFTASSAVACRPWMSLRNSSSHSATTGSGTSSVMPMPLLCSIIHDTTPSSTRPTDSVLVSTTGTSIQPASFTHVVPVISPLPLSAHAAANTFLCQTSLRGMTAVIPVRTGPTPGTSLPDPSMCVTCPTRTPATSVIASY